VGEALRARTATPSTTSAVCGGRVQLPPPPPL